MTELNTPMLSAWTEFEARERPRVTHWSAFQAGWQAAHSAPPASPTTPPQHPQDDDSIDWKARAEELALQLTAHENAMANERRRWREHPMMQRLDEVRSHIAGLRPGDAEWLSVAQSEFLAWLAGIAR